MNRSPIGDGAIEVSRLGLGCSRFGSFRGVGPRKARTFLLRALELGVNLFDTANIYGQGDSETVIGNTFRGRHDEVIIVTKAGYRMPPMNRAKRLAKPMLRPLARRFPAQDTSQSDPTPNSEDRFDPKQLRVSLEGSLRRLQMDHVDIFMLHSLPESLVNNDELQLFLEALKQEGKARAVGYSMTRFPRGMGAAVEGHVDIVGSAVNATSKANLEELGGLAERHVPVLAYQIFGSGQLLRTGSGTEPHLRFALEQGGVAAAIAGVSSVQQLEQNVRIVDTLWP